MSKPRFKSSVFGGVLFKAEARVDFLSVTAARYGSMRDRLKRKKLPPPPFTLEQFRADVLSVMGGKKDGVLICRYCHKPMAISEVAVDHGTPLSRGGSAGLENLDYPCKPCNDRKGGLLVEEFEELLGFVASLHPLAAKDILSRLQKANSLAASARRNIAQQKAQESRINGTVQLSLQEPERPF